jgi:hypothetical protein
MTHTGEQYAQRHSALSLWRAPGVIARERTVLSEIMDEHRIRGQNAAKDQLCEPHRSGRR